MRKSIFFFIGGLILVSTMIADTLNTQIKPDLEKLTYHKKLLVTMGENTSIKQGGS